MIGLATLFLATLLCSLVAGFLFAFTVVTMPGLKKLSDREFIRAFQVIDGVIQGNQPLFLLVWAGSVVTLLLCALMGIGDLDAVDNALLFGAIGIYLLGVQLPTVLINVPLNNKLQHVNTDGLNDERLKSERLQFEPRWNRWNTIRTVVACLTSIILIALIFRL